MIKPTRIEIDGHVYLIDQLPGFEALETLGELTRVLGPGIVRALLGALQSDTDLLNADVGALALPALFVGINGRELRGLTERLLRPVEVILGDRKQPVLAVFDVHFKGRTLTSLKVVWASLKVSFGDFLDAVPALKARAAAAREQASGSPTT